MNRPVDDSILSFCHDPHVEMDDDDNVRYIGDFNSSDLFEGFGIYYNEVGNKIYEGFWKNGLMDGKGIFYYKGLILHQGDWKEGKKHGNGIRYYKNSIVVQYEGEWQDGKKHGHGKLFSRKGMLKYQGNFEMNEIVFSDDSDAS